MRQVPKVRGTEQAARWSHEYEIQVHLYGRIGEQRQGEKPPFLLVIRRSLVGLTVTVWKVFPRLSTIFLWPFFRLGQIKLKNYGIIYNSICGLILNYTVN